MKGRLEQLFDFQKFAKNKYLESIIKDTEARYHDGKHKNLLSDNDLEIFAAGDVYSKKHYCKDEDEGRDN